MNHHLKRLGRTLLAAGATSALALTMTTAPAEAYRTKAGDNAATFLAKRLVVHGNKLVTTYNGVESPAWGQTLDAYFALRSEGVHRARATYVYKNVAAHAKEYVSYGADNYAGATGKLLTAAVVEKASTANVGGVNLVNRMKSLMAPDGQFKDKSEWGNYANTIGQSFAIIGLRRATGTVDARAVAALRKAQCPNGGFRLDLDGGGTSYTGKQLACTSNAGAQADATAYAIQALYTVPSTANKAVANKALNYLASKQAANGGFYALGSYNTNTTGVAAAAFHVGGRITDRNQAISFIKGRQFGCTFPTALRGGIAYDWARYSEAKGQGAAAEVSEQDERATAQATWGLSGLRFQTLSISGSGTATPAVSC